MAGIVECLVDMLSEGEAFGGGAEEAVDEKDGGVIGGVGAGEGKGLVLGAWI